MLVYLASPFNGPTKEIIRQNIVYARLCLLDSLFRGEAPYASHLLYTQVLDEESGRERGLAAGDIARGAIGHVVTYLDLGESVGMARARAWAASQEDRRLRQFAGKNEAEVRAELAGMPLEDFPALGGGLPRYRF